MAWNASLSKLRDVLAMLYPTVQDARRLVEDAGLNPNFIAFDNKAINNWHSILQEAARHNKIEAVVQAVLDEYGENPELLQSWQAYLKARGQSNQPAPPAKPTGNAPHSTTALPQPIVILFLAANPHDTPPLKLDEEVRAIDQALRQAEFRDRFDLRQHWAVRVADLQSLLLRHKPDIVHFSGHGSDAGELILQNDGGDSQAVSVRALSTLFSILKDNIRCVVLNACYSAPQSQAIAQHIDAVVGMSNVISDEAGLSFAAAFYQALGYGRSVKTAFDLGCTQIDLANLDAQDSPQLVAPNSNPAQIVFATATQNQPPSSDSDGNQYNINTGGGAYIAGNVNLEGGDFVGRDKHDHTS